jgi:hypothetical protein
MENFRNKQFVSFESHTILSSMMNSAALFHPAWGVKNPSVQRIHAVYATYLLITLYLVITSSIKDWSACVQVSLILLIIALKCKNSGTGNSEIPEKLLNASHHHKL